MLRLLVAAALTTGVLAPLAIADVATGCLTQAGSITKLALGDEPARPCGVRQTKISLQTPGSGADDSVQTFAVELAGGEEHDLAPGIRLACAFVGSGSYHAKAILDSPYVPVLGNYALGTKPVSSVDQNSKSTVTRYYPLIRSTDGTEVQIERATAEYVGLTESIDLITMNLEVAWIDGGAVCRFWGHLSSDHIASFDLTVEENQ